MPKSTWIFAGILSSLVLLAIGLLQLRTSFEARALAEAEAAAARVALSGAADRDAVLVADLQVAQDRVAQLEEAVVQAEKAQAGLNQQMRSELESREVTISELRGKLTVDILDRILFDSGEAHLKPEGEALLSKVAGILAKFPKRAIQIVGHTDNVPIRSRTAEGYSDNWALSAGRAVSAVKYLTEKAGVDPGRLSAVGCGEFRSIAPNDTAEGRARNRRIAIVVLPEEFVAPDLQRPLLDPAPATEPSPAPADKPDPNPAVVPPRAGTNSVGIHE